jgi:hypothetical protein
VSAPTPLNPSATTAAAVPAGRALGAGRTATRPFDIRVPEAARGRAEWPFGNLVSWNKSTRGGHFAAWEQRDVLGAQPRQRIGPLR